MYALVDVETTGLSQYTDRVVQIAVRQLNADGSHHDWSTLVDPERDPGPSHIHGITADHLRGAPRFGDVVDQVAGLLAGRVVVAHNASFDWKFISQECARTTTRPDAEFRLCTLAMARRLDLPLPDLKLGTLARWAGVQQLRWHDARDDVNTLHGIFHRLWTVSAQTGLPLPYTRNGDLEIAPPVVRAPRIDSPWAAPGSWIAGTPITQGTRFCITGGTTTARAVLYEQAILGELVPMNSVSSRTSLVVANSSATESTKLRRARELGLPVIDEDVFLALLSDIRPGRAKGAKEQAARPSQVTAPLAGRRVLVVGGTHHAQAAARTAVTAGGGRCAVNLTPTVNAAILLAGWEADGRADRLRTLDRLDANTLLPLSTAVAAATAPDPDTDSGTGTVDAATSSPDVLPQPPRRVQDRRPEPASPTRQPAPAEPLDLASSDPAERPILTEQAAEIASLGRGQVIDLPADSSTWHLFVTWPLLESPLEVDVLALVVDDAGRVLSDDHLAFFNSPETPGGSVRVDVATDGEAEVELDLDELTNPGHKVVLAACLTGEHTFGDLGPIEFVVRDGEGRPAARSVLDAATVEKSLLLAEFYQRGEQWRIRAIGQGHEDSLEEFVTRHGVTVD